MRSSRAAAFAATVLVSLLPGLAIAGPEPAPATPQASQAEVGRYVRCTINEEALTSTLDVGIRSFTMKDARGQERTVHLVGAVHIADAPFYQAIQTFLDKQDVVLYEGVRPPGAGDFDASMPASKRVEATKRRLEFLVKVVERHRAEKGAYPDSLAQLAEQGDPRWKKIVSGLTSDAWGHAVTLALTPGEAAGSQQVTLTSAGPDGDAAATGDNIIARGKALAPGQADPEAKQARPNIQQKLADSLGLTYQMKGINYDRANFRPSDMSMDQIQERIAAEGGDADMLFAMLDGSSLPARLAGFILDFVKGSQTMQAMMKMVLVQALGSASDLADGMGDMPGMRGMGAAMKVIIHDRNQVVLDDLDRLLAGEPDVKSIAAFYGAGHLASMEKHLLGRGAVFAGEQWIPAITVDGKAAGLSAAEVKMMQGMVKRQMEAMRKAGERAKAKPEPSSPGDAK